MKEGPVEARWLLSNLMHGVEACPDNFWGPFPIRQSVNNRAVELALRTLLLFLICEVEGEKTPPSCFLPASVLTNSTLLNLSGAKL